MTKSIVYGISASIVLLVIYFTVVSLVSGWGFAKNQFSQFWYFVVSLAVGFGIQVALYTYLKNLIKNGQGSGKILGVTGTTSTAAMISCCAHYLVNVLPILGATGIMTFMAQYQIKFFWVGLLFNVAGVTYMANKIFKYKQV